MQRQLKWSLAALAVMSAACSDGDPMGPGPIMLANATSEVCTTISFEGPEHMAAVGSIDAPELGLTLTTSGLTFVAQDGNPGETVTAPVVFFTQLPDSVEDDDLQSTPPWGDCSACAGLGNIMILPDIEQNPAAPSDPELPNNNYISVFYGDYRWGGRMRISGFTGGEYYIKSFKAIDQEDHAGAIRVSANGTGVLGTASGLGDASVETVMTDQTKFTDWIEFEHGTQAQDAINGSGGVDDVVICKTVDEPPPPPSAGTRTIGYWRQAHKPWPVDNITIGGTVYSRAEAQALMFESGAGDKTYGMFEQLVAAKLNVLSGADNSCIQSVIDDADTWMATYPIGSGIKANNSAWKNPVLGLSQSAGTMHTTLDNYNNGLLCAPHDD